MRAAAQAALSAAQPGHGGVCARHLGCSPFLLTPAREDRVTMAETLEVSGAFRVAAGPVMESPEYLQPCMQAQYNPLSAALHTHCVLGSNARTQGTRTRARMRRHGAGACMQATGGGGRDAPLLRMPDCSAEPCSTCCSEHARNMPCLRRRACWLGAHQDSR